MLTISGGSRASVDCVDLMIWSYASMREKDGFEIIFFLTHFDFPMHVMEVVVNEPYEKNGKTPKWLMLLVRTVAAQVRLSF